MFTISSSLNTDTVYVIEIFRPGCNGPFVESSTYFTDKIFWQITLYGYTSMTANESVPVNSTGKLG